MQKARRHTQKDAPTACRRTVSGTISLRCSRCFSPFPHGTGSLSVSCEYLALADGPAGFTQDFSCPALLRIPLRFAWLRVPAFHRLWGAFPSASTHHVSCDIAVLQPRKCLNTSGLGSSPFARHYLRNHNCFLFLRVLRCFSSPRSLISKRCTWSSTKWVTPFGNVRITGRLHLPEPYRSLPRPSSPHRAKASTVCSCFLFLFREIIVVTHYTACPLL